MRDVSHKVNTLRTATASAIVTACKKTITRIKEGDLPKGDALPVAKVVAIQTAKRTADLIPYCHPIPIEFVEVRFEFEETQVTTFVTVKTIYKTGVEIEAMTAASLAALTLYDMVKMIDADVEIEKVRLVEKRGGKTDFANLISNLAATVITVSDSASKGEREDVSGPTASRILAECDIDVTSVQVVPDDQKLIAECVQSCVSKVSLVVLTGGTGAGPRDVTPEAVLPLFDKELPGVAEQVRRYGQERTPFAMLGRTVCGIAGDTVILCLPGSPKAVEEGLRAVLPHLLHVIAVLGGTTHGEESRP